MKDSQLLKQSSSSLSVNSKRSSLWGTFFVVFGFLLFLVSFFATVFSKLLPPFENQLLAAIQNDWYYCLLMPLTFPVLFVAIYLHWLSMKLFKHA